MLNFDINQIMSMKLFAHINNDAFIGGTRNLEGMQYAQTIAFLQHFLTTYDLLQSDVLSSPSDKQALKHLQDRLTSMLQATNEMDQIAPLLQGLPPRALGPNHEKTIQQNLEVKMEPLVQRILQMENTQSVLMPGGWKTTSGGHAIAYEFKKDENGDLLFLVYNSGAGLEYHESVPSADKERYRTVKSFKIPKKDINKVNLTYFIAELAKPTILPSVTTRDPKIVQSYDADVLYNEVFQKIYRINGEEIDPSTLGDQYKEQMSMGQRQGTCTQKSLHELIKNDITDKKKAKLILFCLKLCSIELFFDQHAHALDDKKIDQLKLSVQNFSDSWSKKDVLPDEIQARANAVLDRVKILIEIYEKNNPLRVMQQTLPPRPIPMASSLEVGFLGRELVLETARTEKTIVEKPYASPKSIGSFLEQEKFNIDGLRLLNGEIEQALREGKNQYVEEMVLSYLTQLPLTERYFSTVSSPRAAIDYNNQIEALLLSYKTALQKNQGNIMLNPKGILALLSVTESMDLIFQHKNIKMIGNLGVDDFVCNGGGFSQLKEALKFNSYLSLHDAVLDKRLVDILNKKKKYQGRREDLLEQLRLYIDDTANRPQGFKAYLNNLYQLKVMDGNSINFSDDEKKLINEKDYQSVIALLHFLEDNSGKYQQEAEKVVYCKNTLMHIKQLSNAFCKLTVNAMGSIVLSNQEKWVNGDAQSDRLTNTFDIWPGFHVSDSLMNQYKEIKDKKVKRGLEEDFLIRRHINQGSDAFLDNNIFCKSDGLSSVAQSENDSLYQALMHLRTASRLQFLTTLDFFQERLDLFSNNSLKEDLQSYLRRNIFQPGIILNTLRENNKSIELFIEFSDNAILYFSEGDRIKDNALFFCQLQIDVNIYVLNMSPPIEDQYKNKVLDAIQKILLKLEKTDISSLSPEDKYRVTKIKLQIQLALIHSAEPVPDSDREKLFSLYMDYSNQARGILLEEKQEKDFHASLSRECVEQFNLYSSQDRKKLYDLALNTISKSSDYEEALKKITSKRINFPYLYGLDETGKEVLSLDLTEGQILMEGRYACYPPATLFNSALYQELYKEKQPKLLVSICTAINDSHVLLKSYEIIGSDPPCRFVETAVPSTPFIFQQDKLFDEKIIHAEKKNVLRAFKHFFALGTTNDEITKNLTMDLPEHFFTTEMKCWAFSDVGSYQDELLIEKENMRYLVKNVAGKKVIRELDNKDKETGYQLIDSKKYLHNSLLTILNNFESSGFIECLAKGQGNGQEIKIRLPRYGIEMQGTFNQEKWTIYLKDQPNLILVDSQNILTKPEVPNSLIFEDKNTKKKFIYTPNQMYYVDNEAEKALRENDFSTVYHRPILDTTNVGKRLALSLGASELNMIGLSLNLPKGMITYTHSEKYFVYPVDEKTKELKTDTPESSLYLAYLNLIHHQPESALNTVRAIIKEGGLKGTKEELAVIDKILNGAPKLVKQINSPAFIAVRLHVLYLVSELMNQKKQQNKKDIFSLPEGKKISKMPENTWDECLLKEEYKNLHALEISFPDKILNVIEAATSTRKNIEASMRLPLELEYKMMMRMGIKKDLSVSVPVKARYEYLKNWYRIKQFGKIQTAKNPASYESDLQKIEHKLTRERKITKTVKKLDIIDFSVKLEDYNAVNLSLDYNDFLAQGAESSFNSNMLMLGITEKDFLKNFIAFYNLARSQSIDPNIIEEKQKLNEFLNNILKANRFIELKKQKSILPSWSATLLTVLENPDKFKNVNVDDKNTYNQSFRFATFLRIIFYQAKSLTPHRALSSIGYKPVEIEVDVKSKPLDRQEYTPKPIQIDEPETKTFSEIFYGLTHEDFVAASDLAQFQQAIMACKAETKKQVEEIKRSFVKDTFGQSFEETVVLRRTTDEDIGRIKNEENKLLCQITIKHLADKSRRAKIYKKCEALITDLDKKISKVEAALLTLANQGPRDPEKRKKFILERRYKKPLDMRDLNRLFVLSDENEYRRVTGLDDADDIQELHNQMAQSVHCTILKQHYSRMCTALGKLYEKNEQQIRSNPSLAIEITELGRVLSESNVVDMRQHADIQFFQKEEGILINTLQAFYLDKLLHKDPDTDKFQNEIIQLIMGGGKSKVIGPLSALKKADGTNLVIFEVKDSLLEVNYADMNAISQRLFNQEAIFFKFERDYLCSSVDLKKLYQSFHKASIDKKYVVTSGNSLKSLELKYLDVLEAPPVPDWCELCLGLPENGVLEKGKMYVELKEGKYHYAMANKISGVLDDIDIELDNGILTQKNLDAKKHEILDFTYKAGHTPSPTPAFKEQFLEWKKQIKYFERTLLLFKEKGDRIIDEIHDELDPTKELNYTLETAMIPSKDDVKLNSDLFSFLREVEVSGIINDGNKCYVYDLISNNKRISDPQKQPVEIMKSIAMELVNSKSENNPILKTMTQLGLDAEEKALLVEYLLNKEGGILSFEKFKRLPKREKDELAFLKFELSKILPFTLMKTYNENYGSSRAEGISQFKRKLAIPYRALNTPNEMARFGQFIESMNYTAQLNVIEDISDELALEVIKDYFNRAKGEMIDSPGGKYVNTKASMEFNKKFGNDDTLSLYALSMMNKEELDEVGKNFAKSDDFKKALLTEFILPLVQINPTVLSSNAQNLAEMTRTTQGMSGTPWNYRAMHQDIHFNDLDGLGTDGETISLLKTKHTKVIVSKQYDSVEGLLGETLAVHDNPRAVRAIIDVGALFKKEASNVKIAEKIGKYYTDHPQASSIPLKYVLYFDNQKDILCAWDIFKKQTIVLGSSDEKYIAEKLMCTPNERFTFYDQARITGTDIVQAPQADALVTFSDKTTQSVFLQGVKRMRQLTSGQTVTIIEPDYLKERVHPAITPVLNFVNKNETDKCLQIHFKGAGQKFKNVLRSHFLNLIYQTQEDITSTSASRKHQLLKCFESIFLKTYQPNHFQNHGLVETQTLAQEYFTQLAVKYEEQWLVLLADARIVPTDVEKANIREKLTKLAEESAKVCAAKILSIPMDASASAENAQEVDLESELENELENELEVENEQEMEKEQLFYDSDPYAYEHHPIDINLSGKGNLWDCSSQWINANAHFIVGDEPGFTFDKNIYMTDDQLKTVYRQKKYYDIYVKPVHVAMMVASGRPGEEGKNLACMILTKAQADEYIEKLQSDYVKHPNHYIWFVSPSDTLLYGTPPKTLSPSDSYARAVEQLRFINGDVKQIALQKEGITWLNEDINKKMQFLEKTVLPRFKHKAKSLKLLKSRFDVVSKIMQHVLDQPFEDYEGVNWRGKGYSGYDALSDNDKQNITLFTLKLKEINALSTKKESEAFSEELRQALGADNVIYTNVMHHKKMVLDKRIEVVEEINQNNIVDFSASRYRELDLNFPVEGNKTLFELILEKYDDASVLSFLQLIKKKRIKMIESNLVALGDYSNKNPKVWEVLDEAFVKPRLTKQDPKNNLLILAAKQNNIEFLNYFIRHYMDYFKDEKALEKILLLAEKASSGAQVSAYFGHDGKILTAYRKTDKYLTKELAEKITDKAAIDFSQPPYSDISEKYLDKSFVEVALHDLTEPLLKYLEHKKCLPNPIYHLGMQKACLNALKNKHDSMLASLLLAYDIDVDARDKEEGYSIFEWVQRNPDANDDIRKLVKERHKVSFDLALKCKTTGWHNNCGLNCLTHFLFNQLSVKESLEKMNAHPEYTDLLQTFKEYYDLKESPTWEEMYRLLNSYPVPHDREAIFAPVLREHLGKVMMKGIEVLWENNGAEAFSSYLNNMPQIDGGVILNANLDSFVELKNQYIETLKNIKSNPPTQAQCEYAIAVMKENNMRDLSDEAVRKYSKVLQDLALTKDLNEKAKASWEATGCKAYVEYVADLTKNFAVTADQLQLLSKKLDICAMVYTPQGAQNTPTVQNTPKAFEFCLMSEMSAAGAEYGKIYFSTKRDNLAYYYVTAKGENTEGVLDIEVAIPLRIEWINAIEAKIIDQITKNGDVLPEFSWNMRVYNSGMHWEYEEPNVSKDIALAKQMAQKHNAYYKTGIGKFKTNDPEERDPRAVIEGIRNNVKAAILFEKEVERIVDEIGRELLLDFDALLQRDSGFLVDFSIKMYVKSPNEDQFNKVKKLLAKSLQTYAMQPLTSEDLQEFNKIVNALDFSQSKKAHEEKAREEKAREEKAREETAREEKAREEKAREEKAREEKAREENERAESAQKQQLVEQGVPPNSPVVASQLEPAEVPSAESTESVESPAAAIKGPIKTPREKAQEVYDLAQTYKSKLHKANVVKINKDLNMQCNTEQEFKKVLAAFKGVVKDNLSGDTKLNNFAQELIQKLKYDPSVQVKLSKKISAPPKSYTAAAAGRAGLAAAVKVGKVSAADQKVKKPHKK